VAGSRDVIAVYSIGASAGKVCDGLGLVRERIIHAHPLSPCPSPPVRWPEVAPAQTAAPPRPPPPCDDLTRATACPQQTAALKTADSVPGW
jgi:hypothetical protein